MQKNNISLVNNNIGAPPKQMTWGKALLIIVPAVIFDMLRFIFEQFWVFGPMLIGVGTSIVFGGGFIGKVIGTTVAGVTAYFGDSIYEMFGLIMAVAIGLLGWLVICFAIFMTNARIFKENADSILWMLLGFVVSEIPLVGSLPGLTGMVVKFYATQIKNDRKRLHEYKERVAVQYRAEQKQIRLAAALIQKNTIETAEVEERTYAEQNALEEGGGAMQ